jgi:hypothetical protein
VSSRTCSGRGRRNFPGSECRSRSTHRVCIVSRTSTRSCVSSSSSSSRGSRWPGPDGGSRKSRRGRRLALRQSQTRYLTRLAQTRDRGSSWFEPVFVRSFRCCRSARAWRRSPSCHATDGAANRRWAASNRRTDGAPRLPLAEVERRPSRQSVRALQSVPLARARRRPENGSAQALERDVAQPGSALDWGSRGPGFESRHPDHFSMVGCNVIATGAASGARRCSERASP